MTDDVTVLLVGQGAPEKSLVDQLESQRIFIERCSRPELENMVALVEPSLVVLFGHEGAEETLSTLKRLNPSGQLRLVVVADRSELSRLRKLDRTIVASLLATDMPSSVVAARVGMLIRKAQGGSLTTIPPSAPGMPASPKPAPLPIPKVSSRPRSFAPPEPPTFKKRSSGSVRPPEVSTSQAGPYPPADHTAPSHPQRPSSIPPSSPIHIGYDSPIITERPRKGPFFAAAQESGRPAGHAPRVAVADTDTTRGDLIACALRDGGIAARLVPLDPAATRWPTVREFKPNLLVVDERAIENEGKVWYQMFRADESLRDVELVALPFDRLFKEASGQIDLTPLSSHIPVLSKLLPQSTAVGESLYDRATLHDGHEEDRETLLRRLDSSRPTVPRPLDAGEGLIPGAQADRGDREKTPPAVVHHGVSSPSEAPFTDSQPAARSLLRLLALGLIALIAAGGVYLYQQHKSAKNGTGVPATSSSAKAAARIPEAPAMQKSDASSEEEIQEEKDPLRVYPKEPVPDCSELLKNMDELKGKSIPHATVAWEKARSTLVLGDLDKALALMCEAAAIHAESLALEGLADLYLIKHAPEQALPWAQKALAARPERRKTQELQADVLCQLGETEQARNLLSKALRVKESDQKTLSAVAVQFNNEASERLRDGDLAGAEKYFRRAFLLDAKNASAAAGVGQVLLKHEAFVGARAWAERALELDPKSGQALVVLGELAVYEGDEEKALKHYQEALAADPGNVRAHQEIYRIRHN